MCTRSRLHDSLRWILYEILDIDTAERWNQSSISLINQFEEADSEPLANARLNLADLRLEKGSLAEAEKLLSLVAEVAEDPGPTPRGLLGCATR